MSEKETEKDLLKQDIVYKDQEITSLKNQMNDKYSLSRKLSENFIYLTWMVLIVCSVYVLSCFTDCVMKNNTEKNKRHYDMEKIKLDNEIFRLRKLEKKVINDAIGITK